MTERLNLAPELRNYVRARTLLGTRVVYYDHGTGPALLLIHGMFGDFLDWEPVLAPLSETYRVVALDLPGFGESDKPDVRYSMEFFTEVLGTLAEELALQDVTVIGNSFGGELAVILAAARPEKVKALVLVSTGGLTLRGEEELALIEKNFCEANLLALTPEYHELMFSPIFARRSEQARRYIEKQNRKLARPDYNAYARVLAQCIPLAARMDIRGYLAKLKCPTLLLWGENDRVFPPVIAEEAVKRLAKGELRVVPDAGHAPQLDNPGEFVAELETFLATKGLA